jgi:uncharacterized protein YjbJ (UPF0337 family)
MANQRICDGNWNEIKSKLLEKWGQLTDDDCQQIGRDTEQLIGVIQQKTGEAREAIEKYLQEISGSAASKACNCARRAAEQARAGYDKAKCVVRDRPAESMLVCFGGGLVAGAVIALALRSR